MSTAHSSLTASRSSSRRPRGWGRALSARKVRKLVQINQSWQSIEGGSWTVAGIHRADRQVRLERDDGRAFRFESFGELGKSYHLVDGGTTR